MSPHGAPPPGDSLRFKVPTYVCDSCQASFPSYAPSRCPNSPDGQRCLGTSFTLHLPSAAL
jgi:hypothetical protein